MDYWKQFGTTFIKECYRTWRGELLASLGVSVASYVFAVHLNDLHAWDNFKIVIESNVVVLGAFALWHLIRTPYLLHMETVERLKQERELAIQHDRVQQGELTASIPTRAEWLDLADRFKVLPYVRANWQTTRQTTNWTINDDTGRSLCILAGSMLLKDSSLLETTYPSLLTLADDLQRWLSYIKATKPSDSRLLAEEKLPDGTTLFHHMGFVEVSKNSEDICIEFAAHSPIGGRI